MWNRNLPRNHFWISNYPYLEEKAEGASIPLAYGHIHHVSPICKNTITKTFKPAGHLLHAINEVRIDTNALVLTADYTADLPNGEFSILSSPYLVSGTTYYFVIEANYPVHASQHIKLWQFDEDDVTAAGSTPYADGNLFTIDNAGVWTSVPDFDLRFLICGKLDLSDPYHHQIDNRYSYVERPDHTLLGLRDSNAHYWLAQSFKPTEDFYCTAVVVEVNNPAKILGGIRAFILDAQVNPASPGSALIGVQSAWNTRDSEHGHNIFPFRTDFSNVNCDIEGAEVGGVLIDTVALLITDVYVNVLKGKLADLGDLTELATLTQVLAAYIESEISFGSFIDKLEAGQQFKMIPMLDGTFKFKVFAAGEPAGILELFDEDMQEFKSYRKISGAVFGRVRVGYDMDLALGEYKFAEARSDIAPLVYRNEETLLFETFLTLAADSLALAVARKACVESPARMISFILSGARGFDLTPGDKIKVNRTHADYAGGTMSGVLFRVISVSPILSSDTNAITAQLDTQTY